jgi:hypothetical protein
MFFPVSTPVDCSWLIHCYTVNFVVVSHFIYWVSTKLIDLLDNIYCIDRTIYCIDLYKMVDWNNAI